MDAPFGSQGGDVSSWCDVHGGARCTCGDFGSDESESEASSSLDEELGGWPGAETPADAPARPLFSPVWGAAPAAKAGSADPEAAGTTAGLQHGWAPTPPAGSLPRGTSDGGLPSTSSEGAGVGSGGYAAGPTARRPQDDDGPVVKDDGGRGRPHQPGCGCGACRRALHAELYIATSRHIYEGVTPPAAGRPPPRVFRRPSARAGAGPSAPGGQSASRSARRPHRAASAAPAAEAGTADCGAARAGREQRPADSTQRWATKAAGMAKDKKPIDDQFLSMVSDGSSSQDSGDDLMDDAAALRAARAAPGQRSALSSLQISLLRNRYQLCCDADSEAANRSRPATQPVACSQRHTCSTCEVSSRPGAGPQDLDPAGARRGRFGARPRDRLAHHRWGSHGRSSHSGAWHNLESHDSNLLSGV
jgi:hypothetical protein